MFRKMRRSKNEISRKECIEILTNEPRGVLSLFGQEGYPYGIPISYFYDETKNKIYFHGAKTGHKIDAIKDNNKASFCVYDQGFTRKGDWALNIKSVIIFGKIKFISDQRLAEEAVRKLGLKFYPRPEDVEIEIKKAMDQVQVFELSIDHMTGKLVNES